ncbi:MAG: LysR substrate-binding domain-containing protein [Cyanobacteria bacterium J06559_3]
MFYLLLVGDLYTQTVDLAIRYGKGSYLGFAVHPLIADVFRPVCSPRLLDDKHPLNAPNDLAHYPLLHFEWIHYGSDAPNWRNWLAMTEANLVNSDRGAKFNEETLAIQAAIAGQGIALCSSIHTADDVALGFLVQPLKETLKGFCYTAVYRENHPKEALILKFIAWLAETADSFSVAFNELPKQSRIAQRKAFLKELSKEIE